MAMNMPDMHQLQTLIFGADSVSLLDQSNLALHHPLVQGWFSNIFGFGAKKRDKAPSDDLNENRLD